MKKTKNKLVLTACVLAVLGLASNANAGISRSAGGHATSRGSSHHNSHNPHTPGSHIGNHGDHRGDHRGDHHHGFYHSGFSPNNSHTRTTAHGTITHSHNLTKKDGNISFTGELTLQGDIEHSADYHSKSKTINIANDGTKSLIYSKSTSHANDKTDSTNVLVKESFLDSAGIKEHRISTKMIGNNGINLNEHTQMTITTDFDTKSLIHFQGSKDFDENNMQSHFRHALHSNDGENHMKAGSSYKGDGNINHIRENNINFDGMKEHQSSARVKNNAGEGFIHQKTTMIDENNQISHTHKTRNFQEINTVHSRA